MNLPETHSKDLFPSIKEGMGSLALVKGNPDYIEEISLNIYIQYYTAGAVPGFVLPAALPVELQTYLPLYIFGLTDFYSSYHKCRTLVDAPGVPPNFWAWDIFGIADLGIWEFNKVDTGVVAEYDAGDMVFSFRAVDLLGLVYWANVVIHCNSIAYGTFLQSFVSDLIFVNSLRYVVPIANINQFLNPLIFGYQTLFGRFHTDTLDPRAFITNKDFQQQIADIPINLPIDKSVMLALRLNFDCNNFNMKFFVNKVEPLTHKVK